MSIKYIVQKKICSARTYIFLIITKLKLNIFNKIISTYDINYSKLNYLIHTKMISNYRLPSVSERECADVSLYHILCYYPASWFYLIGCVVDVLKGEMFTSAVWLMQLHQQNHSIREWKNISHWRDWINSLMTRSKSKFKVAENSTVTL